MRGNNKSIRQNLIENIDSREFRELHRANAKANGDRKRATKAICRLYTATGLERLAASIRSAALSLFPSA